ncbi:MAG: CHASE3 domain-containing protein, partial [Lysobacterales bacterium]
MVDSGRNPLFGFSVAAAILAAVGGFVVFTALRFIQDSHWVVHTSAVLTQVDKIETLERAAIAVQRGYVLLGTDDLRTDFWDRKAELPQELRKLDAMVQNKVVADYLDILEPKVLQRMALAAKMVDLYDRKGLQAAQTYMRNNGGLVLDREIRKLFDDIEAQESRLLEERSRASESSANLLLIAAIGGIPLSLIILGMVYRILILENAERRKLEQRSTESAGSFRKLSGDMQALSKYAGMLQSSDGASELLALTRRALIRLAPNLACTVYLLGKTRDHA